MANNHFSANSIQHIISHVTTKCILQRISIHDQKLGARVVVFTWTKSPGTTRILRTDNISLVTHQHAERKGEVGTGINLNL